MLLTYELTLTDFKEAQINHASAPNPRRPGRWLLYVVAFVMVYLLTAFVVPSMISNATAQSQGSSRIQSTALWLHFFLPFIIVGVMIFVIAGVSVARNRGRIGAASRPRGPMAWAVLAVLAGLLFATAQFMPSGFASSPSPAFNWPALLLPHIGWAALMLFLTFFIIRSQIAGIARSWERQTHIHGAQTADITAATITITGATTTHIYKWSAFPRHLETPNTFLLYLSEAAFQILPKRAFSNAEELNAFRNMARNLIGKTNSAFEVLAPPAGGPRSVGAADAQR